MNTTAGIYLFLVFFLLAFITDILPFLKSAGNISDFSRKSMGVIRAENLDDDHKQRILLENSLGIFKESFKIVILTGILVGALLLLLRAGSLVTSLSYEDLTGFLLSLEGIVVSVVSFISYFLARKLYGRFRI